MKVQLQRKRRPALYNPAPFDADFKRGVTQALPAVGFAFQFQFEKDGLRETWQTTPVQTITPKGKTMEFTTLNSIYVLKKGWGA